MATAWSLTFTDEELRQLKTVANYLLAGPLGVFPGTVQQARARVTAAMKIIREVHELGGMKFLDLPVLAPFAAAVIIETIAGGAVTPARARKHPATASDVKPRRKHRRTRRREEDVPLPMADDAVTAEIDAVLAGAGHTS